MIEIKPGQIWRKKNKRGPDTVRTVAAVTTYRGRATWVYWYEPYCQYTLTGAFCSFRRWAKKATVEVRA